MLTLHARKKKKGSYRFDRDVYKRQEVRDVLGKLAQKNTQFTCFAGAGVYDHYTPCLLYTSHSHGPRRDELHGGRLALGLRFATRPA